MIPSRGSAPITYQLRISGHLDEHWSSWFDDLDVACDEDGTTRLTGPVSDQTQLHGLLSKVRDLNLTLISATRVNPPGGTDRFEEPAGLSGENDDRSS